MRACCVAWWSSAFCSSGAVQQVQVMRLAADLHMIDTLHPPDALEPRGFLRQALIVTKFSLYSPTIIDL